MALHLIHLHKSLNNYQKAGQICERLKEMSEVESDDTNTPTASKRTRITPIRFRDAQLTEGENGAEASPRHDHSAMQQCPPPLPYSLPPVVSPRVSESRSFQQISSISPLPSRFQRPLSASTGTHNSLEGTLKQALQHIMSLLEELKMHMKDVKNRLAQSQPQEKENTSGELPEGIHLPLKSSEDVECLELDLQTDPGKLACLECYLRMRGGFNLKQVVRGILSLLFTNELARSYNFHGLKGKKGLKNHPFLLQTIQDAARKTCPAATEVEVQALIANSLTGARDRDNGRRERAPEHRQLKAF
ncbi:uncharacterized protein LOC112559907 [Pomacea canaliculata]|uniref:uncharacterized protein LOC112559907 n=1 Tax=Pomacea canaliculata TaxID=400727 RepID=UPI000D72B1A9|nr:uncharacterized protein LOC112559907 [Pomacea canaliculata]